MPMMIHDLGYYGIVHILTIILTAMYTITIWGIWIYLIVKFIQWRKYKKALKKVPKTPEKTDDDESVNRFRVALMTVTSSKAKEKNPILRPGEVCFEYPDDGNIGLYNIKIGNGAASWNELPYTVKNF